MNAARRNAQRLLADAKTLLGCERWPAACQLAILAIEEAGKVSVLRGISIAGDEEALKRLWRDYRSHTPKKAQHTAITSNRRYVRMTGRLPPTRAAVFRWSPAGSTQSLGEGFVIAQRDDRAIRLALRSRAHSLPAVRHLTSHLARWPNVGSDMGGAQLDTSTPASRARRISTRERGRT